MSRSPLILAVSAFALAVLWLPAAASASAPSRLYVKKAVIQEALRAGVPPSLALAVAKVESDFDGRALSTAGARGVMQIMPATAKGEFGLGEDSLWEPRTNIRTGVRFLRQLYEMYGRRWDLALSHYNGGSLQRPGGTAVAHAYTQGYVQKVLRWQRRYAEQAALWSVLAGERHRPAPAENEAEATVTAPTERLVRVARSPAPALPSVTDQPSAPPQRTAADLHLWKARQAKSAAPRTVTENFPDGFQARLRAVRRKLDDFSL